MNDEPNTPVIDRPSERPGPPPLRIRHFLVWVVFVAALLTYRRGIVALTPFYSHPEDYPSLVNIAGIVVPIVIAGGQLMIACVAVLWRSRGMSGRIESGEWISIYDSVARLAIMISGLIPIEPADSGQGRTNAILSADSAVAIAALVTVITLVAFSTESRLWKIVLVLLVVPNSLFSIVANGMFAADIIHNATLNAVFHWSYSSIDISHWLLLILIPIACWWDVRNSRQRRWTHWLGASLFLVDSIANIVL